MRDFFQEQLSKLSCELTRMGAACEEIIALASHALTDWDEELVRKVSAWEARAIISSQAAPIRVSSRFSSFSCS